MLTVDIDVGGTLTDGIFSDGKSITPVKVDSTPHDLTVCLFECLTQGAAKLGFPDLRSLLENVELIRWSTTITSNVLAELRGPKLGLIVSQGHEADLYAENQRSVVLGRLVADHDVIGVEDSTSETDVMNAVRLLLESGVRRICISLENAHRHPEQEVRIKAIIDQQYPDHFLGSVPVLAGSEISKSAHDLTRTHCALVNAYTHGSLAATLFKAEDELRQTCRYSGAFLVSHINGGVAGIGKTKAMDTIESGPILGIQGSGHLARIYGLADVVALDVGGTTTKAGVLRDAEPVYRKPSDLLGIPVEISLPYLSSIALGGGSVVHAVGSRERLDIELGPESMGSYPGPACYGLGGDRPTLTDAFVAGGLINADYFLGGTKRIDRELARQAIEKLVAQPLHISTEAASRAIIGRAFESVASLIAEARTNLQLDFSKHVLFAYGGNGGLFACGVAEEAGLDNVLLLSLGPVFSAFGSSVSDVCHVYERAVPGRPLADGDTSKICPVLEEMKAEAEKDLLGEGFRPEGVSYAIELEVSKKDGWLLLLPCSEASLRNSRELQAKVAAALGPARVVHGEEISLDLIRLRVKKEMPKPRLAELPLQGADCRHARTGRRRVAWGTQDGEAQVYRWESLQPGNRLEGCAVVEAANTTCYIPQGWRMVVDRFGNAAVRRCYNQT